MSKEFLSAAAVHQTAQDKSANARRKSRGKEMERTEFASSLLDLRAAIQDALEHSTPEEDRISLKRLSELFANAPHLLEQHQEIMRKMGGYRHSAIDISDPEIQNPLRTWSQNLQDFLRSNGAQPEQLAEVRGATETFFESLAATITTQSLDHDVQSYRKANINRFDRPFTRDEAASTLKKQLAERYPFHPEELSNVVDILLAETEDPIVAIKKAMRVIARIWKEYGSEHKGKATVHASIGVLLQKLLEDRLAGTDERLVKDDKFQSSVLAEYLIATLAKAGIETYNQAQFERMETDIEIQIERRMIESVFFRRAQFDPDTSSEQLIEIVHRGKSSVSYLLHKLAKDALPTVLAVGLSAASMAKTNPFLAPVGLMSVPLLLRVEREKQKRIAQLAEAEEQDEGKRRERMRAYKDGLEQLKTSPDAGRIVDMLTTEISHDHKTHPLGKRLREAFWFEVPRMATYGMVGSIGALLQSVGLAKGKEIKTTIDETQRLHRPIVRLLEIFEGKVSSALRDIERMEAVLGTSEDNDPPGGPLERARKPLDPDRQDIVLRDISYAVADGKQDVLRNVNLHIAQGDYTLIVGKSGSGKTTLLRHLTGLIPPEKGEVRIGDEPIQNIRKYGADSLYAAMAYSNQKPVIYKKMTVRENLMIWMPTETRTDDEIQTILTKLSLDRFASRLDEPLAYASGGETVRIGLARMLLKRASILLLDEPTAGLDEQSAEETRTFLRDLHKKNPKLTIVCVTHDKDLMNEIRTSDDPRARVVTMEEISAK